MDFFTEILDFCDTIAGKISKQLLEDFGKVQADEKADGSLVTRSDKWADIEITEAIKRAFPAHGVLSEEGDHVFPENEYCWIIDPLDGTTNFARGIPIWAISLALFHHGRPVFGYVSLPPLGQTFHAFSDQAFLNKRPIHTSQRPPGKNEFFSFCSRSIASIEHPFSCKIRMLGVASYNFLNVAAGWTVGGVEATPKIWDIAAVWTIVKAAGGCWVSLESETLFPLEPGKDYSQKNYPTMVISQPEWVPVFKPLIDVKKFG